jgi:hypothetical protein
MNNNTINFYLENIYGEQRARLVSESNIQAYQDIYGVHRRQTYSLADLKRYARFGIRFEQIPAPSEFPLVVE